jgi:hypothetical protein
MRSTAAPLASFKIAIACGSTALAFSQNVRIHSETHRTSWLAPLGSGIQENLVEAFTLCSVLH